MNKELIVISARTEERLNVYLTTLRDFFSKTSASLTDIAFTLQRGRESFDERLAIIAGTKSDLINLITLYLDSGANSSTIFRGGKQGRWSPSAINPSDYQQLYENKDLQIAATWWIHHINLDWEQLNNHTNARRTSLPTYPFERKRYWVEQETSASLDKILEKEKLVGEETRVNEMETGELVATFYNKMAPYMKELLGTEDPHLIFAPLAEKIEGFSWLLIYNEPEKHPEHAAIIASKQKEAKQILYRKIDFSKVNKVMDIGCGFSTDLIDLAIAHPHISGDGFTIASDQAREGAKRVQNKDLDDRLTIHCKDSSKDSFPGVYDLVIGFEVFPHIEHKRKTFENIYRHLNQDGHILLADCVTNTVTEINMPDMAMFTSTSPQYSQVLSQVGLKLIECVDISVEIANFLDDPHFESNFAYLCSVNPVIKQFEKEYRGWYSFGQGIKKKVLRYLLLTIGKAEPDQTMEELREFNQHQFDYPVSYGEAIAEIPTVLQQSLSNSSTVRSHLSDVSPSTAEQEIIPLSDGITLDLVERKLLEMTSREMQMDAEQINVTARFADYGVGSLQGVLLIDAINREFDLRLKIQVIYDYSSIRDLSQFLVTQYAQTLSHKILDPTSLKNNTVLKKTDNVSDRTRVQTTEKKTTSDKSTINVEWIAQKLVGITSREMQMDAEQISVMARFADYGVGSLQGLLIIDSINREFDLKLKVQVIYDYSSIQDLSQFLIDRYKSLLVNRVVKTKQKEEFSAQIKADKITTHHTTVKLSPPEYTTDVAVIGMSGRFPGADNPMEFWENLRQGIDSITEVPSSRWDVQKYYDSDPQKPNCSYSKWGGFLRDVDRFDPLFFNISPVEAEVMDPQQRLFLEHCWLALEDAGYAGPRLDRIKCGVFAGVIYNDYKSLLYKHGNIKNQGQIMLGNANSILASRVAYFLNLRGPVMTIDTACSSSLMAVHLACKSLREGETDIMLAGGVTLYLSEQLFVEMSKAGMVSPTGKCKAFDDSADGLVVGEAVATVVLKRLDRAIADGDMIYGVIKGTGTNQDGKTNGITAPSGKSQSELELAVYRQYGIHPASISYVEAHGTGTKLGDPIEVEALIEAFRTYTSKKQYCALASVKSNIGHTSAAAGVVSLIKVLLALRHKMIPPTLHVQKENTHNNFIESPFYINKTLRHWPQNSSDPRRAAINSFGFSGSNCHVVVEEYQEDTDSTTVSSEKQDNPALIVLSAKNEEQLKKVARNLYRYLGATENVDLSGVAYTLQVGRLAMEERLSIIAWNCKELRKKLKNYLKGRRGQANVYHGSLSLGRVSPSSNVEIQLNLRKSLTELAQLWVEGVDIDWLALYPEFTPKIVSLPTYPFARERYWIPEGDQTQYKHAIAEEIEKEGELQDFQGRQNFSFQGNAIDSSENYHKAVEIYLKDILSTVLKIPTSKIHPSAPFEKYGIDSVMIASLNHELESHFGQLPKTLFFERQSLYELTQYFVEHHHTVLPKKLDGASIKTLSAPSNPVENVNLISSSSSSSIYRETTESVSEQPKHQCQEVAIIGISGRYPQADNLEEFWENLKVGKDCITEIPQNRWDYRQYYDPQKKQRGKSYCKWGGFINNVDCFDPLFFNIAPKEAQIMDPQERLFLQTAWETIEDSGYTRNDLQCETVGVFVGALYLEYQMLGVEETAKGRPIFLGYSLSSIANRVSYIFNFKGPSLAVETMCSSSLTAIHLACESIRHGDCDLALAGGVNLSLHPNKYLQLSQNGFAASDGRCRSFGEGGDGYVPGEGVGAIFLKSLDRAIADKDHIYAVIKGSDLNHGGKTNGYTVPNPNAQGLLIKSVLERSKINARTISYVEAHGTGTELGDPIEISGLMQAYQKDTKENQFCSIGSAKANIGHLEAAAGIAAITKVVLQFQHQQLVPSIHSDAVNPNINFKQSPFYLQSQLETWKRPVIKEGNIEKIYPLRAGISSFGAGGANAHLILEEYTSQENNKQHETDSEPVLILLSAKTESCLKEYAKKLYNFILNSSIVLSSDRSIHSIAYTLQVGREAMNERLAIIASSLEELREKLFQYYQESALHEKCYRGSVQSTEPEIEILLHGKVGSAFVQQLLLNQELDQLAGLWTKGISINWQLLYSNQFPQRISLPTYPFAQKRYWIPDATTSQTISSQLQPFQFLNTHPLLDGFDIQGSIGTGVVFSATLSNTDWLVKDHRVKGLPVVPGVGTLEIAIAAFSLLQTEEKYDVTKMLWLQPISVTEDGKKINIVITNKITNKDENFGFEVRSGDIVHAQGEFVLAQKQERFENNLLPIDDIKARCSRTIGKTVHYTKCQEKGVDYGVHFQGLEYIWGNDEEALGLLQLPSICERDFQQYDLHPALVDSALQAIAGLFDPLQTDSTQPMLPYAVEKVEHIRSLPKRGYTYVKLVAKSRYDVLLADEQGQICLKLSDVVLRRLKDPLAEFFYAPSWSLQDHSHPPFLPSEEESVLLVYPLSCQLLANAIANAYANDKCFRFQLASEATVGKPDENLWIVPLQDVLAWKNCVLALKEKVDQSPLTIYFLSGHATRWGDYESLNELEQSQQQGLLSLFRLFKAIIVHKLGDRLRLKVLTNKVYQVKSDETIDPRTSALQGFTASLAREYPQIDVSCLDIDLNDFSDATSITEQRIWVAPILSEPPHPLGEAIALRQGRRYERKLFPVHLAPISQTPFRTKGVYFILGGAGGIGLELCRYLVETVQAKVILVGRNELDIHKQTIIQSIESKGGEVLYLQADATDLDSMKQVVQQARSRWDKIHGVFHSALVLQDKTLENMDESMLRRALDIKVLGSVILHKVFQGEPLDFMLFFSSANSFSGNVGQANYAAGCTFKDAYAHSLGQIADFPVKVINWGYWGTVGIVASEEYNKRLAAAGLYSIQPEQGMESICRLLSHPLNQVMSINANKAFLSGINVDLKNQLALSPAAISPSLNVLMDRTLGGFREPERTRRCFLELDQLGLHLNLQCFQQAGLFQNGHEEYDKQLLKTRLSISPDYFRLFDELLHILARAGFIEIQDQKLISTAQVSSPATQSAIQNIEARKSQLLTSYSEMKPHINLVWVCMTACMEVLRGEVAGTDIMFPNSSMERVEGIYKGNAQVDHYNRAVVRNVVAYIRHHIPQLDAGKKIRILEVGAGTGSTSTMIFDAVQEYGQYLTYIYTDISPGLVNYGRKMFGAENSFVEFKLLDVEKDVEAQGYELFNYDMVIATNVLHATRNINYTLRYIKPLLKTNGWMIINEGVKNLDFLTYTFGFLKGWWLYSDEANRLPGGPNLSLAKWRNVLQEEGFSFALSLNESSPDHLDCGQDVMIAESNGVVRRNQISEEASARSNINVDEGRSPSSQKAKSFSKITQEIAQRNQPKTVGTTIDVKAYIEANIADSIVQGLDVSPEDINLKRSLADYGVDSITGVDLINKINENLNLQLRTTALFDHANIEEFANAILDEYGEQIARLVKPESSEASQISVPTSHESMEAVTSLISQPSLAERDHIESVDNVKIKNRSIDSNEDGEGKITVLSQYSPPTAGINKCLISVPVPDYTSGSSVRREGLPSDLYQAIVMTKPGFPEDLKTRIIQPTEPEDEDIEIEVRAFSLNFSDFLCMRGLYPNMPPYPFTPGSEISGVVLRTGAKVQRFQPGDEVIAVMGEAMGGHSELVLVHAARVVQKPTNLSHAEACAFPIVFLTVNHAFNLANVQPGEKVLIQTAAGGVGLVAVQFALSQQAEIYATAGSSAKLDYLQQKGVHHLINYRTSDFAERILDLTNGQGVDVVLNTLADEAIQKGLNLLAPGGRYIEIAMAGLRTARSLDLSHLVDNQTFQSIDMSRLYANRPKLLTKHLELMAQTLATGKIRPTVSHTFSLEQIRDAYHCLQQRENIGKVVVTIPPKTNGTVLTKTESLATEVNLIESQVPSLEPIAVIGLSGRFPGASSVQEFWHNLTQGIDSITEIPPERWDINAYYDSNQKRLDKTHCRWGGFLTDIDKFDALFFKMSGREAELTDPQQRLFLEEAWKALEDAGYANTSISNSKCGVFVGADPGDYRINMHDAGIPCEPQSFWGNSGSLIAARISYFLNLKGPSITIDTACSSSLVAIHQGCQSIRQGESDMAIAGGVYIGTTPHFHIVASNAGMLATDGKCKTFDQKADGFVPGEGVGAVVLKSLKAARRDGDHIYGIILGSGCNQDGRTYGITAPSVTSQSELEQQVYNNAKIDPATIGYIEAHGTGTKLGDPIEIDALTKAFRRYTNQTQYCAIGSVKSNIGHAATAAGIAGFIKVLLCLKYRQLVPSLHFNHSNEHIDFKNSPFYVNTELKQWDVSSSEKRRAAISSFGFGGTNAHIIVEEFFELIDHREGDQIDKKYQSKDSELILLSAKNSDQLKQVVHNLYYFLVSTSSISLADIAYTLQVGREAMSTRLAFIAETVDELLDKLANFLADLSQDAIFYLGKIKDGEVTSTGITNEELSVALVNRELAQLATWWVSGLTLDWTQLQRSAQPRRVSLPTYPFSRDRYWFDSSTSPIPAASIQNSRLDKNYYIKQILKSTDPLLAQHQIDGKPMFPAVGFMNMVLTSIKLIKPTKFAVLQELFWLTPLYVLDRKSVQLVFEVGQNDKFTYQIIDDHDNATDQPIVYCRGCGYWVEELDIPSTLDVSHLKQRMLKQLLPDNPYHAFTVNQVFLGNLYQGATAVWRSENEALVEINVPLQLGDNYYFHPATFVAALLAYHWLEPSQDGISIPFALQKVERWEYQTKSLPQSMPIVYAYVVQSKKHTLDISILDSFGQTIVRYSGLTLKVFNEINLGQAKLNQLFFTPSWQRLQHRNITFNKQANDYATLFIYHESNQLEAETLLSVYRSQGQEVCSLCFPGEDNSPFDSLDNVLKQISLPLRNVCLITTCSESFQLTKDDCYQTTNEPWYVTGFLALVRKLDQLGYTEIPMQWTLLTNCAYTFDSDDPVDPYAAVIVGLATALAQEQEHWQITVRDRPNLFPSSGHPEEFSLPLFQQNSERKSLRVILERNGNVYERKLKRLDLPYSQQSRLRHNGVYVLVGGAGHLGLILSQYLVQRYQARVIWLGRRKQDESIRQKIEAIATFGPRPQYISLNTGSDVETRSIFAQIKANNHHIHGVFNLVMVPQGIPIRHLSEEQFRAGSFNSKVQSALVLYRVLKHEPLDFLVFFSSMQSFAQRLEFMSANMSSYVAGCMFQDAFTYEINRQVSYPVKTINWGYWSQQQTDTDGIHKQYEAYLEGKGIYSLNAEEGMESLERILNYKSEQVIVAKVSDEVLENLGLSMVKNSLVDSLPDRSSMLNRLLAETNQF